jgi:hypothetical protein
MQKRARQKTSFTFQLVSFKVTHAMSPLKSCVTPIAIIGIIRVHASG